MAIETIGEAWNHGWRITMRCALGPRETMKRARECNYRRELDMETLVCTRGRDFPLVGLETRLRCPRCGSRRVAVMFSTPSMPQAKRAEA